MTPMPAVDPNAVRKSVTVAAPRELAFRVFTEKMTSWWPLDSHHIGKAAAVAAVIEPRPGGRWFERGEDGTECQWGSVRVWDPPHRIVLSWDLSVQWQYEATLGTELEVRFVAESPLRTRVELTHRLLDRYGAARDEMRARFDGENAWSGLLARFRGEAERVAKESVIA